MSQYIARGLLKIAEQDDYNEGCLPDTGITAEIDYTFTGNTPQDVIEKIQEFLDVDQDGTEINACDEDGRVDFSKMEDANGETFPRRLMGLWKIGNVKAWAATYTTHIEKVDTVRI